MEELHPLARQLLARIESHPEEFRGFVEQRATHVQTSGWDDAIYAVRKHDSKADKDALNAKLDAMYMEAAYERMLDELLNGDERRHREEAEKQAAYAKMQAQQAYQQNLSSAIQNPYFNGLQNQNTYTAALGTISAGSTLQLGDEKIDSSLIKQIKGKLGL